MIGEKFFYHGTLTKSAALFGTLFNEVFVKRGGGAELFKVPLSYGGKDKVLARLVADPSLDKPAAITLPRMSFKMLGFTRDSGRKLAVMGRYATIDADADKLRRTYNPVPVNVDFALYVYASSVEDAHMVIEQIVPYFTPDWTVTADLMPEMGALIDVPVIMTGTAELSDDVEGDLQNRRVMVWTIPFKMKTFLYGPVKPKPIIKFAEVNYWASGLYEEEDGIASNSELWFTSVTRPGLTANGEPTIYSSETINAHLIFADDDYGAVVTSNTTSNTIMRTSVVD